MRARVAGADVVPEAPRPLTRRELRALADAALESSAGASAAIAPTTPSPTAITPVHEAALVVPATAPLAVAPQASMTSQATTLATPVVPDEAAAQAPAVPPVPQADAFHAASVLFAATPTGVDAPMLPAAGDADAERPAYLGTEPRRSRSNFRRITATTLSVSVIGVVTALTVAMAFPAAPHIFTAAAVGAEPMKSTDLQAFVASAEVKNSDVVRAVNYESVSVAQIAAAEGIAYSDSVFTNDPSSPIQWPYAVGTSMSYGYGMRDGRMHEGIDFTPGSGAPIQAIADGKVRIATEQGGGYGVTVYIDHVIDGKVITSHYSHMQYGSLRVKAGDTVKVGDPVGLTGNTGHSFGAHLHFELIVNGSTIDPMPWLKKHAG